MMKKDDAELLLLFQTYINLSWLFMRGGGATIDIRREGEWGSFVIMMVPV